jgi:antibiotic biosynthesis monooxygenase (ABM) superfamily enzyme
LSSGRQAIRSATVWWKAWRAPAATPDEFSAWQKRISTVASEFPGFIEQTVMPPNPPA